MVEGKVPVQISKSLYDRVKAFIEEQGGFSDVEEFIEFVLEELTSEESEPVLSKEDEEKVKQRLRALGYI